jgi:hypothetical protein
MMPEFVTLNEGEHTPLGGRGSVRDSQRGKLRFDLIGIEGLERLTELYTRGADKYGEHNWRKGQPVSRYWASLLRHAFMWAMGYRKEDHLAAVCWNAFGIMHVEKYPEKFADLLDHERYSLFPDEGDTATDDDFYKIVLSVVSDYQVKFSYYGGTTDELYSHYTSGDAINYKHVNRDTFADVLIWLEENDFLQLEQDGLHTPVWQAAAVGRPVLWGEEPSRDTVPNIDEPHAPYCNCLDCDPLTEFDD